MEYLCDYIVANIHDANKNALINVQTYTYDEFSDIDNCLAIIKSILHVDNNNIAVFKENIYKQREVVISVKYNGHICNFCEHYDTQMDYVCVRILPV